MLKLTLYDGQSTSIYCFWYYALFKELLRLRVRIDILVLFEGVWCVVRYHTVYYSARTTTRNTLVNKIKINLECRAGNDL